MWQAEPLRHARRNPDGPIGPGGDDTVDGTGTGQALDRLLILGRDHRTLVRKAEPGRERVTVGGDHGHVPDGSGLEQAELCRSGA